MSLRLRLVSAIGASALAAAALGGLGAATRAQASVPAGALLAVSVSGTPDDCGLNGVSATSPGNAWAVGWCGSTGQESLLLHWNGRAWSQVQVPTARAHGPLLAVTAVSATDVWAVGETFAGPLIGVLILHCNGKTCSTVTDKTVSNVSFEAAALAATAHDVWVAAANDKGVSEFLHLTGGRWYVVPTNLPPSYQITSVAVVSPTQAWAAGAISGQSKSFLIRWNGSLWKLATDPMAGDDITALASGPGGAVWAVGRTPRAPYASVSMRWDGGTWHLQILPAMGGFDAVGFIPSGTAWATGATRGGKPLIARRSGTTWQQVPDPAPSSGELFGVAATSASNAWAVGDYTIAPDPAPDPLILHWNGKAWS